MATFFNVLANIIVILATLTMIAFIGRVIFTRSLGGNRRGAPPDDLEIVVRVVAVVIGFLIYVGSKAVGLSIPELMLSAIGTTNLAVGIVGVVLPGFAGTIVAWYCLRTIRKHEEMGMRLVILLSTFIVVLFGDAYVAALQTDEPSQQGLDPALLPNLTFTIGLGLYVIFNYRHRNSKDQER